MANYRRLSFPVHRQTSRMSRGRGVGRSLSVRHSMKWRMVGTVYISQTEKNWVVKFHGKDGKTGYLEIQAKDEAEAMRKARDIGEWVSLREIAGS